MFNFIFIVKMFLLSLLVLVVMQVEVGSMSVEARVMGFVRSSSVVEPLREAARGGAKLVTQGYERASRFLGTSVRKALPEESGK